MYMYVYTVGWAVSESPGISYMGGWKQFALHSPILSRVVSDLLTISHCTLDDKLIVPILR